jgi:hypothetical protein
LLIILIFSPFFFGYHFVSAAAQTCGHRPKASGLVHLGIPACGKNLSRPLTGRCVDAENGSIALSQGSNRPQADRADG